LLRGDSVLAAQVSYEFHTPLSESLAKLRAISHESVASFGQLRYHPLEFEESVVYRVASKVLLWRFAEGSTRLRLPGSFPRWWRFL